MNHTSRSAPAFTSQDVAVARAMAKSASPGALIWTWWDYGYFLQYVTGKKTFMDGGTQHPERTFVAAYPMACQDPELASNWMRYFAQKDLDGLREVSTRLGGADKAVALLKEVFSSPQNAGSILAAHGFENTDEWVERLFPNSEVLVYLSRDLLDKAYWWYYFGSWDFGRAQGDHARVFAIDGSNAGQLEKGRSILINGEVISLNRVILVDSSGGRLKGEDRGSANGGGSSGEHTAVIIGGGQSAYIVDQKAFGSLASRLLIRDPLKTQRFRALAYDPAYGGGWRVE